MSRHKSFSCCHHLLSAAAVVAESNAPRRAQRVAAGIVKNCTLRVSIIAATAHRHRSCPTCPHPTCPALATASSNVPQPTLMPLSPPSASSAMSAAAASATRTRASSLKPTGSVSATDLVSVIRNANCPHCSVAGRRTTVHERAQGRSQRCRATTSAGWRRIRYDFSTLTAQMQHKLVLSTQTRRRPTQPQPLLISHPTSGCASPINVQLLTLDMSKLHP
jgi:hypothetical protein